MVLGTRRQFQAAIDKAQHLGTVRTVVKVNATTYTVQGSRRYTVRVMGTELVCECKAADSGVPDYHAAAVYLHRLGEQASGRLPNPYARRTNDHGAGAPAQQR